MPNDDGNNDSQLAEDIGGQAEETKEDVGQKDNIDDGPKHSASFGQNKSLDKTIPVSGIKPGEEKEITVNIDLPPTTATISGTMPVDEDEIEEELDQAIAEQAADKLIKESIAPQMMDQGKKELVNEAAAPRIKRKGDRPGLARKPKKAVGQEMAEEAEEKPETDQAEETAEPEIPVEEATTPEPTQEAETPAPAQEPGEDAEQAAEEPKEQTQAEEPDNVVDFAKKKQELGKQRPTTPSKTEKPADIIDLAQRKQAKEQEDKRKPDDEKEKDEKEKAGEQKKDSEGEQKKEKDAKSPPKMRDDWNWDKQDKIISDRYLDETKPEEAKQFTPAESLSQKPQQLQDDQARKEAQTDLEAERAKAKQREQAQQTAVPKTGNRFLNYLLRKGDKKLQEFDNQIKKNKEKIKKIDKFIRAITTAERGLESTTSEIFLPVITTPTAEISKFFLRGGKEALKIKNNILSIEKAVSWRKLLRNRKKAEKMDKEEEQAQQQAA